MFNLIAFLVMCVGGINWFCIGLFQFDIIAGIFGSQAHFVSRFLYVIIGLATIYSLIALPIQKGKIYEPKKKDEQKENEEDKDEESNNTENETEKQEDEKTNKTKSKTTKKNNDSKTKTKTTTKKSSSKNNKATKIEEDKEKSSEEEN